jgi:hypothetical protein
MYVGLHAKYLLLLSDFNQVRIFNKFSESSQIQNFMKIRPLRAEFHAERQI